MDRDLVSRHTPCITFSTRGEERRKNVGSDFSEEGLAWGDIGERTHVHAPAVSGVFAEVVCVACQHTRRRRRRSPTHTYTKKHTHTPSTLSIFVSPPSLGAPPSPPGRHHWAAPHPRLWPLAARPSPPPYSSLPFRNRHSTRPLRCSS